MRTRLILVLMLATLGLGGCEAYQGPTATCFSLMADETPCGFHPVAGGLDSDA